MYSGNVSTDGLVAGVDRRRAWMANYLASLGPARLISITLVVVAGMVAAHAVQNRLSATGTGTNSVDKPDPDYDTV